MASCWLWHIESWEIFFFFLSVRNQSQLSKETSEQLWALIYDPSGTVAKYLAVWMICSVATFLNWWGFYTEQFWLLFSRTPVLYFSQCLDAGDKVSLMQPGASLLKKVSVSCPCQGYLSKVLTMFHWFEAFIMSLPPFYKVKIKLAWRSLGYWLVLAGQRFSIKWISLVCSLSLSSLKWRVLVLIESSSVLLGFKIKVVSDLIICCRGDWG